MNRRNQFRRRFKISEEERQELYGANTRKPEPKPIMSTEEPNIETLREQKEAMEDPAFMSMNEMLIMSALSEETTNNLIPYRVAKWYFVLQANNLLGEWMEKHPDQENNIDIGSAINTTRAICCADEWQIMQFELSEKLDDMTGTELMKALPILHEEITDEELCQAKKDEMIMAREILLSSVSGKELEGTNVFLQLIETDEVLAIRRIEFWLAHYEYDDIEPIQKALWNLQVANAGSNMPEQIQKMEEERKKQEGN